MRARCAYTYDNGGWPASLQYYDAVALVADSSYGRDRLGNITGITTSTGPNPDATSYTLDALYQLNQVAAPTAA